MEQQLEYQLETDAVTVDIPLPLEKSFDATAVPHQFSSLELSSGHYVYGYGTVEGITDESGDQVTEEALIEGTKDLDKPPYNKIFLNHEYKKIAVGMIVYKSIVNTSEGKKLLILAKLNDNLRDFDEIWKSIQDKYLDSFSIGGSYGLVRKQFDPKLERYVNKIIKFNVREVSLTSYPALSKASVIGTFEKTRKLIKQMEEKNMTELKKQDNPEPPAPQPDELSTKVSQLMELCGQLSARVEAVEKQLAEWASKQEPPTPEPSKEEGNDIAKRLSTDDLRKIIREEFAKATAEPTTMRKSIDAGAAKDAQPKNTDRKTPAPGSFLSWIKNAPGVN